MIVNYYTLNAAIVNGCDPGRYSCEVAPVLSPRLGLLILLGLVIVVRLWS